MDFDLSKLTSHQRYKLLTGTVVPRPIALVTTVDLEGRVNAAPFSFFNALGHDPAVVAVGIGQGKSGQLKDTARNIQLTGEFVVNAVDESMMRAVVTCGIDFPNGVNELEVSDLATAPAVRTRAPRIACAPVSLECRHLVTLEIGRNRIVLGEVLHMHVRDDAVDPERFYVYPDRMGIVGRMQPPDGYVRTRDTFDLPSISFEEWQDRAGTPPEDRGSAAP